MDNYENFMSKLPFAEGRYVVIDTETTGFDTKDNMLISISAVEIIDAKITGSQFNAYVRSRENLGDFFWKKNPYYYIEDYSNEIYELEKFTLQNFLNYVGESIIFAHNANFDANFINSELKKWNITEIPLNRFRCTLQMIKKCKNKNTTPTLESLCKYYKIRANRQDYHHGPFDAYMLARIVCKFLTDENLRQEVNRNEILYRQAIHEIQSKYQGNNSKTYLIF
jgi:DNA polymerase-3 subunit epsilon